MLAALVGRFNRLSVFEQTVIITGAGWGIGLLVSYLLVRAMK